MVFLSFSSDLWVPLKFSRCSALRGGQEELYSFPYSGPRSGGFGGYIFFCTKTMQSIFPQQFMCRQDWLKLTYFSQVLYTTLMQLIKNTAHPFHAGISYLIKKQSSSESYVYLLNHSKHIGVLKPQSSLCKQLGTLSDLITATLNTL